MTDPEIFVCRGPRQPWAEHVEDGEGLRIARGCARGTKHQVDLGIR